MRYDRMARVERIQVENMKKIVFNDRYGLTQAVIEGRKTVTRRIEFDDELQKMVTDSDSYYYDDGYLVFATRGVDIHHVKTRYKVGEVVAVAQSYQTVGFDPHATFGDCFAIGNLAGWNNKLFVKSELMPHQILITSIRCERLQDISDADCMKSGVTEHYVSEDTFAYSFPGLAGFYLGGGFPQPKEDAIRKVFALVIDKISGKGSWERNPWVLVYEFELVK